MNYFTYMEHYLVLYWRGDFARGQRTKFPMENAVIALGSFGDVNQ